MSKTTIKKTVSVFIAALILLSAFFVNLTKVNAMPLDPPFLFYNDSTWAREDRCPLRIIEGEYYVPLVLFAQLKDCEVKVNNSLNTFVISHGDKYISFDASTDIAINQSDTYLYIRTYKLDYGERYVPAEEVCKQLKFEFEHFKNERKGEVAVRISDSTAKYDFETLLEKYNPGILKLENDTSDANTDSGKHQNPDITTKAEQSAPSQILGNRIIYITFTQGVNDYTSSILDTLSYYGYKATFFIDDSDITNHPLVISRIISEGHKIGIMPQGNKTAAYTDTQSFISELDNINELLYRVYKIKTRTVCPNALAKNNALLFSDIISGVPEESGYSVYIPNVERTDGLMSNVNAINKITAEIYNKNTLVLSFGSNASTRAVLSGVLNFIYENRDKCDVRLADSAYTPPR